MYISLFLKSLWNYPEAIYHIINNLDLDIVKSNFASFIANYFYCNYLSGNYMENNLLYVITMLLKDEIDKLENINQVDTFLENTKCGYLIEELIKMPDIQIYFKNVIIQAVEKIERTCSFRDINFDINERLEELKKIREEEEKKLGKKNDEDLEEIFKKIIDSKLLDQSLNFSKEENSRINNERYQLFNQKYIADINIKEFQMRADDAKRKNKIHLYEYYNKLINEVSSNKDKDIYSISTLMKNMLATNLPTHMFSYYLNDFLETISFIDKLIEDLKKNILLLPNSVKYICKIISILIKKKFKNISKDEENSFISKFIIEKLLIPIISSPSSNALIDFIISGNTKKNINVMNFIIKKLFSGKLFYNDINEGNYTPFNWYFMEKIENIFYIFENVLNVNLPNFIEKYIKDELPKDYIYEFFNENKDEFYANISICFTIENLFYLIKGLENSTDFLKGNNIELDNLKKILSKIKSEFNEILICDGNTKNIHKDSLKNSELFQDKKQKIINYYLYNDKVIDKQYNNLFSINNQVANFYINIKKEEKIKKLNDKEINIIKVKNYLCNILGNYRLLNKSDFNIENISNTIKILNQIKSFLYLPNFIINNNNIPSIWYINSVLDYLNKIPDEYKENDFRKLFDELNQNLKDSINNLDFGKLIIFKNKIKFIDKMDSYYEKVKELINNIIINKNVNRILEKAFIPIDIKFNYNQQEKIFEISKSNIKEKYFLDNIIYEDPKKKFITCRTIEAFTRYFPNLAKYQSLQDISPIDIIKELSIEEKINNYFQIIQEKISKKDENLFKTLYKDKIKDYIMDKIYEKIYPPEPDDLDNTIFNKTMKLSWVEPQLIIDKEYIFDNMLPDILNEFKQIHITKSPFKKLKCLSTIINDIINLIKFNEGLEKEVGAEEITPVLNYVSIKAHPFMIYTDLQFIKIFSKKNKDILIFESIYDLILNYTAESFHLSDEEYRKKCQNAIFYRKNSNVL